jgi:hypothetical protein
VGKLFFERRIGRTGRSDRSKLFSLSLTCGRRTEPPSFGLSTNTLYCTVHSISAALSISLDYNQVMQFQYNADYPDERQGAREPLKFPDAQPVPCARITTRVYHPVRQTVATVQNVLVRTAAPRPRRPSKRLSVQDIKMGDSFMMKVSKLSGNDGMSSSSSSSESSSDESMEQVAAISNDDEAAAAADSSGADECAYWIQRTVREAIYGRVLFAVVLRKRKPSSTTMANAMDHATATTTVTADWEITAQHCAVKEMSWQHIRRERDHLAEDPVKEVGAMQFLKDWHAAHRPQQRLLDGSTGTDTVTASFRSMLETNVMMPLDLLSDERHLYSIMPYCNGGELFELLDMNERFTEPEARYWMQQVLNVRFWYGQMESTICAIGWIATTCIASAAFKTHIRFSVRCCLSHLTTRPLLA